MDISQIFEDAKKDPSLLANLDLDALFSQMDASPAEYLANTTLAEISATVYRKIKSVTNDAECIADLCSKLTEYRCIDEIFEIQKGKYIRSISLEKMGAPTLNNGTPTLNNGGIVVDIKFTDTGTHVLCKNRMKFFQIPFDKHLIFQKLSTDEQLYLMACQYI
jgi:hypothetical protein